jgi:hypothetical protein
MVLVAYFALPITAAVAVPLFFLLFRKRGWLKWWQVALAGLFLGLLFVALMDSPARLDMFGIRDSLLFGGVGLFIAIVFWWLGLFRNAVVPSVPSSLPYSMLVLVPLVALGVLTHRSFSTTFAQGRIIAVKGDAPSRELTIRLSNGAVVEASFLNDARPTGVLMNQCWHLIYHWSTWRFRHTYSPTSPFGGGVNDC